VGYFPGRQEESSQEILKSHKKCWWIIMHFVAFLKAVTHISFFSHRNEVYVTRISFLSKVDIMFIK
jgi:hypothetical protein